MWRESNRKCREPNEIDIGVTNAAGGPKPRVFAHWGEDHPVVEIARLAGEKEFVGRDLVMS
jgi:hypothetical protein